MPKDNNRRRSAKQKPAQTQAQNEVSQTLDEFVRQAVEEKLPTILEQELNEYLGRQRYERSSQGAEKPYQNGYGKERRITCGCGQHSRSGPPLMRALCA